MFVRVKLKQNYEIGSVVSYSAADDAWQLANDLASPIAIIEEIVHNEETAEYWARCAFAGISLALADRAIPDQGGYLALVNGRVYVDNTSNHCGIIAPLPSNQQSRTENDLVMVYLR